MLTFDRYLLRLFVRVLFVCFVSITGLYIVIDAFNNLDEFLNYGRQEGSLLSVLANYYSARVPWFFDRTSSLLALIAAMFAATWLQRTREMTALLAAGVPKWRIACPLMAAAVAVSLTAAANREFVIPQLREKLVRNAQDWRGENARQMVPVRDHRSDILLDGRNTVASEQRIEMPSFVLDRAVAGIGGQLLAANAFYRPPAKGHPGGYLLVDVQQPQDLAELASVTINGRAVILTPHDTRWLKPNECFVVSDVPFEQLEGGGQWRSHASTAELIRGLQNPSLDYGLGAQVTIHSRVVQPFLDVTLFFLGLPLVLNRENRNIFLAAGWCLMLVLCFLLIVIGCQAMGERGYLLSPALAAWLPLFLFVPAATALSFPIFE